MIYSIKSFSDTIHPDKSERTVRRMIKSGLIDPHFTVISVGGIFVIDDCQQNELLPYLNAIRDYCRAKKMCVDLELSTVCGIKNNVSSLKLLNEILGL